MDGGASRVEIYHRRARLVGIALGALAFAAGGALLAVAESGWVVTLVGFISVVFFGGGGLYLLWRAIRPAPAIAFDIVGISGKGWPTLRWDEVERMWVSRTDTEGSSTYTLALKSIQPGLVRSRQAVLVRPFARLGSAIAGGAEMTLPLDGLQRSPDEILELVEQYARKPVDRTQADWKREP